MKANTTLQQEIHSHGLTLGKPFNAPMVSKAVVDLLVKLTEEYSTLEQVFESYKEATDYTRQGLTPKTFAEGVINTCNTVLQNGQPKSQKVKKASTEEIEFVIQFHEKYTEYLNNLEEPKVRDTHGHVAPRLSEEDARRITTEYNIYYEASMQEMREYCTEQGDENVGTYDWEYEVSHMFYPSDEEQEALDAVDYYELKRHLDAGHEKGVDGQWRAPRFENPDNEESTDLTGNLVTDVLEYVVDKATVGYYKPLDKSLDHETRQANAINYILRFEDDYTDEKLIKQFQKFSEKVLTYIENDFVLLESKMDRDVLLKSQLLHINFMLVRAMYNRRYLDAIKVFKAS